MNENSNLVNEKKQKPDSLFDRVVSKLQNTKSGEERTVPNTNRTDPHEKTKLYWTQMVVVLAPRGRPLLNQWIGAAKTLGYTPMLRSNRGVP